MSGHSKWSTIKHKKGAADAKRGKIFTKIIREITVAARAGGEDPKANSALRSAILKARSANMPNDSVERAIKKGIGDLNGVNYEELSFEGYGPGGIALFVDCLTDNRNRTAADVRNIFSKNGGSLGSTGCVAYLFSRKGIIIYDSKKYSEDNLLEVAIEAGSDDVRTEDGHIIVTVSSDSFTDALALLSKDFEHVRAEIAMIPERSITVDSATEEKIIHLIDILEDYDDVQYVASNIEFQTDDNFGD